MASAAEPLSGMHASGLPAGPGLIATFGSLRDPYRFLDDCARRYGDWFTIRVPSVVPFVFTRDPIAIREIFLGDPEQFHAGKANRPLGAFMGERSVLFLDGAAHLRERRLLLPAFGGERMKSYALAMRSAADDAIARWPVGELFPIHPWMRSITFDVIVRTVLGLEDGPKAMRLRELIRRLFEIYASPLGAMFALSAFRIDLGRWSPWGRAVRLYREIESLFYAEFERRRNGDNAAREDILSMLLRARDESDAPMSNEVLRDEMFTLLLAGHETTAASMAWVIHRLLSRPDVMESARAENARILNGAPVEPEHVGSLKYLEAVINETMRLNPVVPNAGRHLEAPAHIAGRSLPAGVVIAPCIYLTHRHPDLWSEPDRFKPERFLDSRISPYAFFPFGGGVRRCIGAAFASYQMKIVLTQILSRVELAPVSGYHARSVRRSIALAPSDGLPVIVARRL